MRQLLDRLYGLCGGLAAACTFTMLCVVLAQMVARWTGNILPGGTNYAGYLMACSSFLAFAYALNHGAHIRVSLLLNRMGKHRRFGEIWCLIVSSVISLFLTYYCIKFVLLSYQFGEVSQGMDRMKVWIPQVPMAVGAVVLSIALLDNTWRAIRHGQLPRTGSIASQEGAPEEKTDD